MANNETDFRTELVQAARAAGGHAVVTHGALIQGIPDLYIQIPGWHGFWLECKFAKREKASDGASLALTAGQRLFLRQHQRAGGLAGWALCLRSPGRPMWELFVGANSEIEAATVNNWVMTRTTGEAWDMAKIYQEVRRGA